MNEDIYAEWLVKRKRASWVPFAWAGAVLLGIISLFLMFNFKYGFIAFVLVAFTVFIGRRYLSVEYEYTFVTNELSIDRIFSQAVRKNALTIEMSTVESVEKTNKEQNAQLCESPDVRFLDFTSHEEDVSSYTILFDDPQKGRCLLEFEPNDKVLNAMWRCSPTKVKI